MQQASSYPKQSDYPDWHYQPIRLLKQEMENPLQVIESFFSGYTLPQARRHFKEMLEDAMCNVEVYAINYLTFYDSIEKLIEAAWLLEQREITDAPVPSFSVADTGLDSLIKLLIATICPERIFLLSGRGSHVADLLIVVPDSNNKPFSHYDTLIEAASCGIPGFSFSLHASSAFHQHIEEAHPFWLSGCTEEKQVYRSGTSPFPQPQPGKREALRERMRNTFLTGMSRSCFFLESAQAIRLHADSGIILFLLHQSVELLFRALILSLTGTEVREHSIAILRKQLRRCAPGLYRFFPNDTEEEKALLSLLDAAYRKGRYDDSFSPGKEQVSILFKRVEELHDIADKEFTAIFNRLTQDAGKP